MRIIFGLTFGLEHARLKCTEVCKNILYSMVQKIRMLIFSETYYVATKDSCARIINLSSVSIIFELKRRPEHVVSNFLALACVAKMNFF